MLTYFETVAEAANTLRKRLSTVPGIAIVLGSGLGAFASRLESPVLVPYGEIPHFAVSTVSGHAGQLVAGTLEGVE